MSKGINYYLSISTLLFLQQLVHLSEGLFEYICEEKQLFKPYVHVYRGRKGERILEAGPGFHVMTQEQDIYVCVNGPAYLYFARTTELGQVYEAPQPHVYSHTCEMYNVKPHSKATQINYELHLMAVLLYGDQDDYRRPAIQRFTAPYFFDADEYMLGSPKHYQNATSVAVIGESECTLEKGERTPKIPIIIQPNPVGPPDPAGGGGGTPPPTSNNGERPEKDGYLCRLGFSDDLKDNATGKPDDGPEKKTMRLMVNDEPIRVLHCDAPYVFDKAAYDARKASLRQDFDDLVAAWPASRFAEISDKYVNASNLTVEGYNTELTIINAKIDNTTHPPSAGMLAQLNKKKDKLTLKITLEEDKKNNFTALVNSTEASLTSTTGWDDLATAEQTAETDAAALKTAQDELKALEDNPASTQADLIAGKEKIYAAETVAYESAKAISQALSAVALNTSRSQVLIDEMVTKSVYTVSKLPPTKPQITYTGRTIPEKIPIASDKCEKLPRLSGDDGECKKGKPDKEKACNLFKMALGKGEPWDNTTTDFWKQDVMDLSGAIFVNACPYLPNRRKFVRLINLIMGFYVRSEDYFNQLSTAGTSDSCRAFKRWQKDPNSKGPDATAPVDTNANKEQREFWRTIIEALTECKNARRSLTFVDTSPTFGKWDWVKPDEAKTQITIEPYREQAEKEYVFNWVIDMSWRIFGTALGICMPGYEEKIPLITARFYSMFTEDFLIPLRETWVNSKDNLIFQWILGEFYNGDAENWAELCMEASYFYSEREDYRPLRSLLVNCASEHNYFISGKFAGTEGRYAGFRI